MKNKSQTKKQWVKLIEGTQSGNKEDFEELCRLKTPNIMFLCKSALNNWQDAEDAAQEVMIKMQKDISKLINPEAFPAWLDRLCINVCLTMRRKRMKEQFDSLPDYTETEYQDYSPESFPADRIETAESRKMVMDAIEALPYSFRMAIILHYYEGLTAPEVAEVMNITLAMAKHNIQRGRIALRDIIKVENHENKYIAMSVALPIVINKTDMIISIERSANVLKASGIPLKAPPAKKPLSASITIIAIIGGLLLSWLLASPLLLGPDNKFNPIQMIEGQNTALNAAPDSPDSEISPHLISPSTSPNAESSTERAPQLSQEDSSMGEEQGKSSSSAPTIYKAGAALMGQISLDSPYGSGEKVQNSIAGVTVQLVNAKSPYNVVKTTKTMGGEHSGWYLFENVKPASYLVRPVLPVYFQPSQLGGNILKDGYICCNDQTVFTLKEGKTLTLNLPVYQTGTISGNIIASQPELKNQLSGILIKLYDKQSILLMKTETQLDGSYTFNSPPILEAGTCYLRFYIPASMGMSLETNAISVDFSPGKSNVIAPNTVADNTPPSLDVFAYSDPANPAPTRSKAFKIHTFDTGNIKIAWTLEDGEATVAKGTDLKPGNALDNLKAGIYVLDVIAEDRVGNISTYQTIVCLG